MTFDEMTRDAARLAGRAGIRTMDKIKSGRATDEGDVGGVLIGALDTEFDNHRLEGITFSSDLGPRTPPKLGRVRHLREDGR